MTYAVEYILGKNNAFCSDSDIPHILRFRTAAEALEFVDDMKMSFKDELAYIFIHCLFGK